MQTKDWYSIELLVLDINTCNQLNVCKQTTDVKLNCYCYIAIHETISLRANKWALTHFKIKLPTLNNHLQYIFVLTRFVIK